MTSTLTHYYVTEPAANDWVFAFAANEIVLREGRHLPCFAEISLVSTANASSYYCFADLQGRRCLLLADKQIVINEYTANNEQNYGQNNNQNQVQPLNQHLIPNQTLSLVNMRQVYTVLSEEQCALSILGKQLFHWRLHSQFCGCCGLATIDKTDERAKVCVSCNVTQYPRLSPVVIVLITRGEEILLARSPHFRPNIYSAIAGFVELGESLEQAIHREVKEEIGVNIKNIQYVCSDPWPFPDSLMIGFLAEYDSGEIVIDAKEIEHAAWFSPGNLPLLPPPSGIGHKIIKHYFAQYGYILPNAAIQT